jgi:hypothetical protein
MEGLVEHAWPSVKVEKNRRSACNESGVKQGRDRFEVAITRPFLPQPCGKGFASGGAQKGQVKDVSPHLKDELAAEMPRLADVMGLGGLR